MGRNRAADLPAMRRHPKGYARARIAGKEYTLGPWGSAAAQARFDELVAEWLSKGRTVAPPRPDAPLPPPPAPLPPPADITIGELGVRWLEWLQDSRGVSSRSSAWNGARAAIRAIRRWRDVPAKSLGPRLFQEIRRELAATPFTKKKRIGDRVELVSCPRSRRYVLDTMSRVRQLIGFGVSEEWLPGDQLHSLEAVPQMPDDMGEHRPRRKRVPMEHYLATLDSLTPATRAIVEFIAITGCRPSEAASIRMDDLEDQAERVWKFLPVRHKSRWRGKPRIIPVGPKAQEILIRSSAGKARDAIVFDARESIPTIRGTSPNRKPSIRVKGPYSAGAIRVAIQRAAHAAGVPAWTTYQLRHLRLQEVRKLSGREAAQAVAGHNRSTMVDHYAPPSWEAGEAYAAVHG